MFCSSWACRTLALAAKVPMAGACDMSNSQLARLMPFKRSFYGTSATRALDAKLCNSCKLAAQWQDLTCRNQALEEFIAHSSVARTCRKVTCLRARACTSASVVRVAPSTSAA